ncbi:hypothetical protein [Roseomonas chloroacetimidivorans]|uniref:hypothetical protein n=1 Tax=Roseomonas chloroacetimidivorans TaxID=1766656 RepID=UPI003C73DD7D
MTEAELRALREGDVVQHANGDGYVVILDRGNRKIAVRTVEVSNPAEWKRVGSDGRVQDGPIIGASGWGTNTGHGHVWPRPDGVRMRCGGPPMCAQCARDLATYGRQPR